MHASYVSQRTSRRPTCAVSAAGSSLSTVRRPLRIIGTVHEISRRSAMVPRHPRATLISSS
eukprot:6184319-Pleurochrysis_carterae.AAC.2